MQPQAGGPPLVGCPRLLIQYIRSYPPYLRTHHTVVTGAHLSGSQTTLLKLFTSFSLSLLLITNMAYSLLVMLLLLNLAPFLAYYSTCERKRLSAHHKHIRQTHFSTCRYQCLVHLSDWLRVQITRACVSRANCDTFEISAVHKHKFSVLASSAP